MLASAVASGPGKQILRESLCGSPLRKPGEATCAIVAMCRTSIIVRISTRRQRYHGSSARRSNPSNLRHPPTRAYTDLEVMGGLWNCQSAVKKADSISAYASLMTLHFLALTKTWIAPENSATPAALSTTYSFSPTPRPSWRGMRLNSSSRQSSPTWSFHWNT